MTEFEQKSYQYHSCYVVSRPILSKSNIISHWAIKFVGYQSLLTVEYFDNSSLNIQIIPFRNDINIYILYRFFLYSSINQCDFNDCNEKKLLHYLSTRWEIIEEFSLQSDKLKNLFLNKNENIGKLMFIRHEIDHVYRLFDNNCQTFVRDIIAVLNVSKAKILNFKFDYNNISRPLPPIGLGENFREVASTYETKIILEDKYLESLGKMRKHNYAISKIIHDKICNYHKVTNNQCKSEKKPTYNNQDHNEKQPTNNPLNQLVANHNEREHEIHHEDNIDRNNTSNDGKTIIEEVPPM